MRDYIELYDIAKVRSGAAKNNALRCAEQFVKDPSSLFWRELFLKSLEMSKRWDWLKAICTIKMLKPEKNYYNTHKKEFLDVFRVRPQ